MKLYCGGCQKDKFGGLFSESQRKCKQDSQRRCFKCVQDRSKAERKRNKPRAVDHGWRDSNAIFFRRQDE